MVVDIFAMVERIATKLDMKEVFDAAYDGGAPEGKRYTCPRCYKEDALSASFKRKTWYCHRCAHGGDAAWFIHMVLDELVRRGDAGRKECQWRLVKRGQMPRTDKRAIDWKEEGKDGT